MGWMDGWGGDSSSYFGDLFSSNAGGDSGVGGNWTDYFGSGSGGSDGSSFLGTSDWGGGSGGGGGGWLSKIGSMFGGGGSGGQGGSGGGIFGMLLSGLSGSAGAWMDGKSKAQEAKIKGEQDRKTLAYTADLQDYFKQKDKVRKRVGLDTYGQFSQLKRWAPNYVDTPMPDQPAKPSPTGY